MALTLKNVFLSSHLKNSLPEYQLRKDAALLSSCPKILAQTVSFDSMKVT